MNRSLLLVGLAASVVTAPIAAQDSCAEYARTPAVGSWSQWQSKDGKMRLSVIGSEKLDGKDYYWFEMQGAQSAQGGKSGIIQLLTAGWPYQADGIKGMVMKAEGQPAMKANEQMLGMMRSHMTENPAAAALRDCSTWTKVGEESVTVPAGTFSTMHLKDSKTGNEVWASKDVAFGMVKGNMKQSGEIQLIATGTGAKSSITETPVDMGSMMHQ